MNLVVSTGFYLLILEKIDWKVRASGVSPAEALGTAIMATMKPWWLFTMWMDDSLYDKWTDSFSLMSFAYTSSERKKLQSLFVGQGIQSVRFSQAGFDVTDLTWVGYVEDCWEESLQPNKSWLLKAICLICPRQVNMWFCHLLFDQSATCKMRWKWDVFKEVYNVLNEDGVSPWRIRLTRLMRLFQAILTMKMRKSSPCSGIPTRSWPHRIVHELTFLSRRLTVPLGRHDEVHEERDFTEVRP